MQGTTFYDDAVFENHYHAGFTGKSVPHTCPPLPVMQGSTGIEAAGAKVLWSVDPTQTVLHLLFLAQSSTHATKRHSDNEEDGDGLAGFACRKWVLEFQTDVIACGVCLVPRRELVGENDAGAIVRAVWLGADLSVHIWSFTVSRSADASQSLLVTPREGTEIHVRGLPRIQGDFVRRGVGHVGAADGYGHVHATVLEQVEDPANLCATVVLTDGHALWKAVISVAGDVREVCLVPASPDESSSLNASSQSGNGSRLGWSLFGRWTGGGSASSGVDENLASSRASHTRRTILDVRSIPSTSLYVAAFAARGFVVIPSSLDTLSPATVGRAPSSGVEFFGSFDSDLVPQGTLMMHVFCRSLASAVEPSERHHGLDVVVVDIACAGRAADADGELLWWHRGVLRVARGGGSGVLERVVTQATLLSCVSAPRPSAYLQTCCVGGSVASVVWTEPATHTAASPPGETTAAVPISILSLLAVGGGRHNNEDDDDVKGHHRSEHTTYLHQIAAAKPQLDAKEVTAAAPSLYVCASPSPTQVVCASDSDGDNRIVLVAHRNGNTVASLVTAEPRYCLDDDPVLERDAWLLVSRPFAELMYMGALDTPSLPFISWNFCAVHDGSAATSDFHAETVITAAAHVGLRLVASHAEGPHTLLALLVDALAHTANLTTMAGFHELAAAAHIHRSDGTRHPVSAQSVLATATWSTRPTTWRSSRRGSSSTQVNPRELRYGSRLYIQQAVGLELLGRILPLTLAYVAWIGSQGHTTKDDAVVQRHVRDAFVLLTAAFRTADITGPLLPQVAMSVTSDIVSDVVGTLLTPPGHSAVVQAVEVAERLWQMGGSYGWRASQMWAAALVCSHPVLQHFALLRLVESGRSTSSTEICSRSRSVAAALMSLSAVDCAVVMEVLLPELDPTDFANEAASTLRLFPRVAGLYYRAAVLRRCVPRHAPQHTSLSAGIVASSFLVDVLELKAAQGEIAAPHLDALVADVYLFLARVAVDEGNVREMCFWLSGAVTERPETCDLATRCLMVGVDLLFQSGRGDELVHVAVGNPDVLEMLTTALMHYLQRKMTRSTAAASVSALYVDCVTVYRFLIRRNAFGQAARLVTDVSEHIRLHGERGHSRAAMLEQLSALALSAVAMIPPESLADTNAAGALGSGVSTVSSSSASLAHGIGVRTTHVGGGDAIPATSSGGGLSAAPSRDWTIQRTFSAALPRFERRGVTNKAPLRAADMELVARKFVEACMVSRLAAKMQALESRDVGSWGEDPNSPAAEKSAEAVLRHLCGVRMWSEARVFAQSTQQSAVVVLQSQGLDLLEDPLHRQYMQCDEHEKQLSVFAPLRSEWQKITAECVAHASRETNYAGLVAPLAAMLQRHSSQLIPATFKEELECRRPSHLIHLLLDTLERTASSAPSSPVAAAELDELRHEIMSVVARVLSSRSAKPQHALTTLVRERVAAVAQEVRNLGKIAEHTAIAQKVLALLQ